MLLSPSGQHLPRRQNHQRHGSVQEHFRLPAAAGDASREEDVPRDVIIIIRLWLRRSERDAEAV